MLDAWVGGIVIRHSAMDELSATRPAVVGERTKVFISYSRKDSAFAGKLLAALNSRGFKVYLDTKDILPDEPGQERLAEPICSADTVVFIISPDAIASKVCAWEAEESQRAGKRILPVVWQRTGHGVPPGPATAQLHQSGIALVDPMRPKATRIGCDGAITRAPVQGHVIDCPPHCI